MHMRMIFNRRIYLTVEPRKSLIYVPCENDKADVISGVRSPGPLQLLESVTAKLWPYWIAVFMPGEC